MDMMNMVDMQMPKMSTKEKKEVMGTPMDMPDQPKYPYGLQLTLNKEQVDKLAGTENYKVGDKVQIMAEATVTAVRQSENQNRKIDHSIELQIEQMSCMPKVEKKPEQMTPKEYKTMRMGK